MKNLTFTIILLVLLGTLATAFVLAEELTDVSQLETLETTNLEMQETASEIAEQTKDFNKVGFADIWRGNGWITNEEKGFLIYGFWAHQSYTKNRETDIKHLAFGKLKIAKVGNYKIIKENQTNLSDSIVFYVIPIGTKITRENAEANSVGTLSLNKDKEYADLVIWSGTLVLNSGANSGTYQLKMATIKNTIKPAVAKTFAGAMQDAKKAKSVSFWRKIQFWRNKNTK